jgi:hypothetical protein
LKVEELWDIFRACMNYLMLCCRKLKAVDENFTAFHGDFSCNFNAFSNLCVEF